MNGESVDPIDRFGHDAVPLASSGQPSSASLGMLGRSQVLCGLLRAAGGLTTVFTAGFLGSNDQVDESGVDESLDCGHNDRGDDSAIKTGLGADVLDHLADGDFRTHERPDSAA